MDVQQQRQQQQQEKRVAFLAERPVEVDAAALAHGPRVAVDAQAAVVARVLLAAHVELAHPHALRVNKTQNKTMRLTRNEWQRDAAAPPDGLIAHAHRTPTRVTSVEQKKFERRNLVY